MRSGVKFVRQVSLLLATRAAVIVLTFLGGLIVARSVGPAGKGGLTVLASLVTLASVVAGFGFAAGGVHLYKARRYSIGTIAGSALVVWAVSLVTAGVILGLAGEAFRHTFLSVANDESPDGAWLWLSYATLPGLLLSSLVQSVWLVDNRMRPYVGVTIGTQLVGFVLVCVLVALWQWGVTGALVANLGAQTLAFIACLVWLRSLGAPGQFKAVGGALGPVLRASQGAYWNGIVANIFKHGEALLLAVLLDLRSVGHYGVALAFYQLLTEAPRAVVWPLVGRLTRGDAPTAEITASGLRLVPVALVVPVLAMVAAVPSVISVFYGEPFAPAGTLLAWMAPGVVFRSIHLVVYSYLVVVGRLERIVMCVGGAAAANLVLDLLIVPSWGLSGVAFSNVVSEAVLAVLSVVVFLRETRLPARRVLAGRADLGDLWGHVTRVVGTWTR